MSKIGVEPATAADSDELSRAFGVRVRRLRDGAGMTLEQLSERSGVSRAMLSKVERGEKSPTIGIATRIAHALDTSLSNLVGGDATGRAVAVVRRQERPVFRDPETGFERHIVSPAGRAGRVELLYHYLPPGASTGTLPPYPPGTEKQVVVTEGDLFVVTGRSEQRLASGDALVFDANLEHAFENRSSEPCGYYLIVSRQS